jgi:hypothetical protein
MTTEANIKTIIFKDAHLKRLFKTTNSGISHFIIIRSNNRKQLLESIFCGGTRGRREGERILRRPLALKLSIEQISVSQPGRQDGFELHDRSWK